MSTSFELPEVDRFTTGTVGPPGQRVFFLQGRGGGQVVTLRLEKLQVAALAEYLAEVLADLPAAELHAADLGEVDDVSGEMELAEPVVAEWVVGSLAVAAGATGDRVVVQAEELLADDELGAGGEAATARFGLTRAQVASFIVRAATVVASGRPTCPLCGAPDDPEGHLCVKTNGHREH